jgi:hypothetical protein
MEVLISSPSGTYPISEFVNKINLGYISVTKYRFVNLTDAGFLPIINEASGIVIVNDLTSGGTEYALSAEQGKVLKDLIDNTSGGE